MHMIVFTGQPAWISTLDLPENFILRAYTGREGYVSRLTDERPVLILVDGHDADRVFWCATPKSSPATRRIPIMLIADDAKIRADALKTGADVALPLADLTPEILKAYSRIPDVARQKQLDCDCADDLPPLAVQGVEKFNNREFYPQHDLFEEQWVNTGSPVRDLYRAVLQVGVAYYQIERGNHRGALKMLLRAVQWLEALPDVCQTINVARLREDAYAVRATLEAMEPDAIADFDRTLLKPVLRVMPHD